MTDNPFQQHVERIVAALGIDAQDIEQRKQYLEFAAADIVALRQLQQTLFDVRENVIEDLYAHLREFEVTAELLAKEGVLERLKRVQLDYLGSLTQGDYDEDYVRERLGIGVVHQRIGLKPKWYIGAYCKFLTSLLPEVVSRNAGDPERITASLNALLKVMFFDMSLAIDTYIHADEEATLAHKQYAESILCSIPMGVIAFTGDLRVYSANAASDQILGRRHDDIVGAVLEQIIPAAGLRERINEVMSTGRPQYGVKLEFPLASHCEAMLVPISYSVPVNGGTAVRVRLLMILEDLTETQRLRQATIESDARAHAIMDNVADGIITIDERGIVESMNGSAEAIFGYDAMEVIGRNIKMLMPEPYQSEHDHYLERYISTGKTKCINAGKREVPGKRKNGEIFPMDLATSEVRIGERRVFIGVARDITERKRDMMTMSKLSSAIQQAADSVVITDCEGLIEYVNPAFESLTGYSSKEAIGNQPNLVKSGRHSEAFYRRLWSEIRNGRAFNAIFVNRTKQGGLYYEEKTITPLRDDQGHITHFVSTGKNVSERVRTEEQLDYLAHHDALTELPNRLLFIDRLKQALGRAARHKLQVAVLFLDLDRFKQINDTLGHDAGDLLLQAVAKRMSTHIRAVDSVARFGGDEFAILMEDVTGAEALPAIAQEILDALNDPFMIIDREIYITTSIGISLYPGDGGDPQSLLKNADTAMYRAKSQGKNTYRFYTADMNAKALERLTLENSLRRALERGEFVLHYQPQVDIRSGRIIGMEALLRWKHPGLGLVQPMEFVPLLEETGLIVPVGEWVIQEALGQIRAWRGMGYGDLRMAINLSAYQVREPEMLRIVEKALRSAGSMLDAQALEFEITESLLMENVPETINKMHALRELGARLSLDDFGTGYSSLSYLKRFPFNTVKIDRSFVGDITADPDDAAIASAVIAMAHSLKLDTVAEGVETQEQLAFLRERGCDTLQGYLFSRPIVAGKMGELLASQPR